MKMFSGGGAEQAARGKRAERGGRRMGDWGRDDDGGDTAGEGKSGGGRAHAECERGAKLKAEKGEKIKETE